jgi:hypothetical protein
MVTMPSEEDWEIWRKLHPSPTPEEIREKERRQPGCQHSWAHRNDGKISSCTLCGYVRDNEL